MLSGRLSTNVATATDDFPYNAMQSYVGFEPGMANQRPALQHHLYDNLDFAAAAAAAATAFPFQESPLLPIPASIPMAPPPMPMSLQMPMPGMAPDVYPLGLVKREGSVDIGGGGRIGLNLGRRTYFSPGDVLAVDRLLMRSRLGGVFGLSFGGTHQPPRCQAEGCKADLSGAKHYHRRHKVCEYHAKAAVVVASGKQQRFCQQCSRFHVLAEFDEAKRSCRKRLAEHNRRRRKPTGVPAKDSPPPSKKTTTSITSSYTTDDKTISATKSTISSNASVISCLDQSKGKPTLSLGAKQGEEGFNTTLQVQGHEEHLITSLMQHNNNSNNNILSCSSVCSSALQSNGEVSDHNNNNGNMHLFEVDFM